MEEEFAIKISALDRYRIFGGFVCLFFLYINLEVYEGLRSEFNSRFRKFLQDRSGFSNLLASHPHQCFGLILSY